MMLRDSRIHSRGAVKKLDNITRHTQLGDWMLLYFLSKNMEVGVWAELISELHILLKDSNGRSEGGHTGKKRQQTDQPVQADHIRQRDPSSQSLYSYTSSVRRQTSM